MALAQVAQALEAALALATVSLETVALAQVNVAQPLEAALALATVSLATVTLAQALSQALALGRQT